MNKECFEFIETYLRAIKEENAAIFAGAGLSVNSGYINWKELMREIAEELGLDVDRESDLIEIAQFYRNTKSGRGSINQKLVDEFTKDVEISENHHLLAKLPIKTYWTTNYDRLIENALEQAGKIVDVKISSNSLSYAIRGRDAIINKMHGDILLPNEAVLTKDDYENYSKNRQMFISALQGDLVNKTFLFWGFSFDDPNLVYILSRIRLLLGESRREHYCFFRKIHKEDFVNYDGSINNEEYAYALTKQQLKIQDLKRYSIQAILVNSYSEITDMFKVICKRLKEDKVFISGAASQYEPWEKEKAEWFIHKLSKRIAEQGLKVVSGFGVGIGSSVINGVLSHVYSTKSVRMDEYLTLKPFPQNIENDDERKKMWHKYREYMLVDVGIVIFLFGNKIGDTGIKYSEGMLEEFELAVQNKAIVIPVGCTEYMSRMIWERVLDNAKLYYGNNESLINKIKKLGDYNIADIDAIVENIMEIIKTIRDKRRERL